VFQNHHIQIIQKWFLQRIRFKTFEMESHDMTCSAFLTEQFEICSFTGI
jgi:hypothetical protein